MKEMILQNNNCFYYNKTKQAASAFPLLNIFLKPSLQSPVFCLVVFLDWEEEESGYTKQCKTPFEKPVNNKSQIMWDKNNQIEATKAI